jgi:predicted RNA methylase
MNIIMFEFENHYINWRKARLVCIEKYIVEGFFKSKTLLELGCGHGHLGNEFFKMGANVTCSDARKEHIDIVNIRYPELSTILLDCDTYTITTKYDIVLHWGVLYHLREIENHLQKIGESCDILLLETEVCDSDNDSFFIQTNECGPDQAFNTLGIRPSQAYVEKVLSTVGFKYKCIIDPILNSESHIYDWKITNSNTWKHGLRRFWICWKNVESPLRY